tara:strand:- start:64 stop:516 length:453 start_codon:yes stop_codon:yes gene_type:complete
MKRLRYFIIACFVLLAIIQFIPRNFNSSIEMDKNHFYSLYQSSTEIQNILDKACIDCHSSNTKYPAYSYVQPLSLFIQKHIDEGKAELNLSEFGLYSKRKKRNKIQSMINQIKRDKMPLKSYTYLHRDAVLSSEEKYKIINYLKELKSQL